VRLSSITASPGFEAGRGLKRRPSGQPLDFRTSPHGPRGEEGVSILDHVLLSEAQSTEPSLAGPWGGQPRGGQEVSPAPLGCGMGGLGRWKTSGMEPATSHGRPSPGLDFLPLLCHDSRASDRRASYRSTRKEPSRNVSSQ